MKVTSKLVGGLKSRTVEHDPHPNYPALHLPSFYTNKSSFEFSVTFDNRDYRISLTKEEATKLATELNAALES